MELTNLDDKYLVNNKTGFEQPNKNSCLKYVLVGITPGVHQTPEEEKKEVIVMD